VLEALNSEPYADLAPAQVYNQLLDAGQYLCSIRSMYRILDDHRLVRERRNVLRHPHYQRPELLATGPNQVWSWDITKLLGPVKWTYFHLYVLLDIFSRYVVGWLIADREKASLAKRLIAESSLKQGVPPGQLTIHADRGTSMMAKTTAQLLADLSIAESHSRPRVSNDNPYSESHFKTLKYRPDFPERFGSQQHAEAVCRQLFTWYNTQHRHSGLAFLTPECVHYGRAQQLLDRRQRVLDQAHAATPERFIRAAPRVQQLPAAVWINPPEKGEESPIGAQ
jgi:putative transposase